MIKRDCAIIIPSKNEYKSLSRLINRIEKKYFIIVVDDYSDDKTQQIKNRNNLSIIQNNFDTGYDFALLSGILKAIKMNFKFCITFDADGEHNPKDIKRFVKKLDLGFDVVVGSRQSISRFSEIVFSKMSNYFYQIEDPMCGMKGYRLRTIKKLEKIITYSSIGTELLFRLVKNKKKYSNIKIKNKLRIFGESRFGGNLKSNFLILQSMFNAFIKK